MRATSGEGILSGERVERRLAAILAADVAGYSRLMGSDEAGTLQRLNATKAMRWKERRFEILDREALAKIANYELAAPRARRPFI